MLATLVSVPSVSGGTRSRFTGRRSVCRSPTAWYKRVASGEPLGVLTEGDPDLGQQVRVGGVGSRPTVACQLCNGLVATIGLGQHRADGYTEPPLVTLGQDVTFLPALLPLRDYGAADVIACLLGPDGIQP